VLCCVDYHVNGNIGWISQEFAPTEFPKPPCDIRCTIICGLQRDKNFALCKEDCMQRCSESVKTKTLPKSLTSPTVSIFLHSLYLLLSSFKKSIFFWTSFDFYFLLCRLLVKCIHKFIHAWIAWKKNQQLNNFCYMRLCRIKYVHENWQCQTINR